MTGLHANSQEHTSGTSPAPRMRRQESALLKSCICRRCELLECMTQQAVWASDGGTRRHQQTSTWRSSRYRFDQAAYGCWCRKRCLHPSQRRLLRQGSADLTFIYAMGRGLLVTWWCIWCNLRRRIHVWTLTPSNTWDLSQRHLQRPCFADLYPALDGIRSRVLVFNTTPPAGCSRGVAIWRWQSGSCGASRWNCSIRQRRVPLDIPPLCSSVTNHANHAFAFAGLQKRRRHAISHLATP
jgi:hypothetical protein